MPGPYRRIDHPNVNSFVVGAVEAPKKAKAVKKVAAAPEPKPVVVEEAVKSEPADEPTPAA